MNGGAAAGGGCSAVVRGRGSLQPGGLQLDLSAIAKGYGADQSPHTLRACGVAAALVEVGGEIRAYGRKPDGGPSARAGRVGGGRAGPGRRIARARGGGAGRGVATSGDRWHRFEHWGRRYTHTLDPRTGVPVGDAAASVTVIAADAMHADAWPRR